MAENKVMASGQPRARVYAARPDSKTTVAYASLSVVVQAGEYMQARYRIQEQSKKK
jgi:hypothetical protein